MLHRYWPFSLANWQALALFCPPAQVSQHADCRVRVRVMSQAGSVPQEGHKVSLGTGPWLAMATVCWPCERQLTCGAESWLWLPGDAHIQQPVWQGAHLAPCTHIQQPVAGCATCTMHPDRCSLASPCLPGVPDGADGVTHPHPHAHAGRPCRAAQQYHPTPAVSPFPASLPLDSRPSKYNPSLSTYGLHLIPSHPKIVPRFTPTIPPHPTKDTLFFSFHGCPGLGCCPTCPELLATDLL